MASFTGAKLQPTLRVCLETVCIFVAVSVLASLLLLGSGGDVSQALFEFCTSWRLASGMQPDIESFVDRGLDVEIVDSKAGPWLRACGTDQERAAVGAYLRARALWSNGELLLEPRWKVVLARLFQEPTAWAGISGAWQFGVLTVAPLVLLLAGIVLMRRRSLSRWVPVASGWGARVVWVGGLATAGVAVSGLLVHFGLVTEQPWVKSLAAGTISAHLSLILVAIFLAPVGEEVFFRGYVFRHLRQEGGQLGAYLVSTGLFAAFHGFAGGLPAYSAYGLLLAWGYDKTRDLAVPVLAHMLINTVAVALVVLNG